MKLEEKKKKGRKWPYDSVTYTTGNPALNIAFFNKCMGTDIIKDNDKVDTDTDNTEAESETAVEAGTPEGIEAGGEGLGEQLTEAKRDVRRYFIRPQHIFCANKAEVLKALVEVGNNNCSVYTLKNLEDNDDIHKLTNKDIIYYYDDGILYDKNHVRVMDYDLYIRHEEERKHFGNPDTVSDAEFNKEYADRITDQNLDEGIRLAGTFNKEKFIDALNDSSRINPVYIGYNSNDAGYVYTVDDEQYSNTDFYVYQDGHDKYVITERYIGKWGAETEGEKLEFNSLDELVDYVSGMALYDCPMVESLLEEFGTDFTKPKILNESSKPKYTCCICGEEFEGYGNNPAPYKDEGVCCDACNAKFVIPARLEEYQTEYDSLDEELKNSVNEDLAEACKKSKESTDFDYYECFGIRK